MAATTTKAEAEAKLTTLYVGVGYPETWRDYSGYEAKPGDAFGNLGAPACSVITSKRRALAKWWTARNGR